MKAWFPLILLSLHFVHIAVSQTELSVAIQPLGGVKAEDLTFVKTGIEALYAVTVKILPEKPLPEAAYYAPRERYKAHKLIEFLASETPEHFTRVVGITTEDISTTKGKILDWGVFGLAAWDSRACVISMFRLHTGQVTGQLFQVRLVKVVNHELGHTFGLEHCPTLGCIMQECGGKISTLDGESGQPCSACAARLPLAKFP